MSSGDTSQFTLDSLIQSAISNAKALANIVNTTAVSEYNLAVANANENNPNRLALGLPLIPMPTPPWIYIVNEAAVTAIETKGTQTDGTNPFIAVRYVPITPPAPPPKPPSPIVFQPVTGVPGMFSAVSGDGPQFPDGFPYTDPGTGHTYVKHVMMTPFGGESYWQQTA